MEIAVARADGERLPRLPEALPERPHPPADGQPAHPTTAPLADLYISPLEFDPGRAGGRRSGRARARARADGRRRRGPLRRLRPRARGQRAGADGERAAGDDRRRARRSTRGGRTERAAAALPLSRPDGQVETPPVAAARRRHGSRSPASTPARAARCELVVDGVGATPRRPARLSLDVTRKPLIRLVWCGLYVVLSAGGPASPSSRLRQTARRRAATLEVQRSSADELSTPERQPVGEDRGQAGLAGCAAGRASIG